MRVCTRSSGSSSRPNVPVGWRLVAARLGADAEARSRDRVAADDLARIVDEVERLRGNVNADFHHGMSSESGEWRVWVRTRGLSLSLVTPRAKFAMRIRIDKIRGSFYEQKPARRHRRSHRSRGSRNDEDAREAEVSRGQTHVARERALGGKNAAVSWRGSARAGADGEFVRRRGRRALQRRRIDLTQVRAARHAGRR